ncbi:hypothetical protein ACLVWQ_27595 [Streptomyces sp. CWNU-52B]|uniref:hypothetical protein n=1 Tax=unclassified Streptomyces TaxID=2593676 RepID=UPI0039C0E125
MGTVTSQVSCLPQRFVRSTLRAMESASDRPLPQTTAQAPLSVNIEMAAHFTLTEMPTRDRSREHNRPAFAQFIAA